MHVIFTYSYIITYYIRKNNDSIAIKVNNNFMHVFYKSQIPITQNDINQACGATGGASNLKVALGMYTLLLSSVIAAVVF